MKKLLLALALGAIAGIIDIIPMVLQRLDRYSICSALVQWVVLGFVISYIDFGVKGWLKGLVVAVILALPIIILVMKTDLKSILPILVMSAILGSAVGYAGERLVK